MAELRKSKHETGLIGRPLVDQVIDPEIREFNLWFGANGVSGQDLTLLEKELLRAFLHWKYTEVER